MNLIKNSISHRIKRTIRVLANVLFSYTNIHYNEVSFLFYRVQTVHSQMSNMAVSLNDGSVTRLLPWFTPPVQSSIISMVTEDDVYHQFISMRVTIAFLLVRVKTLFSKNKAVSPHLVSKTSCIIKNTPLRHNSIRPRNINTPAKLVFQV